MLLHGKEANVKKTQKITKLEIKKVTLQNLDDSTLDAVAGVATVLEKTCICTLTCYLQC